MVPTDNNGGVENSKTTKEVVLVCLFIASLGASLFWGRDGWWLVGNAIVFIAVAPFFWPKKFTAQAWVGVAIIGMVGFSLIPMPPGWLSPQNQFHEAYENINVRLLNINYGASNELSGDNTVASKEWIPTTLNKMGTWRFLLSATLVFIVYIVCQSTSVRIQHAIIITVIAALTIGCIAGILSRTIWPQGKTIMWLTDVLRSKPMGPFVNKNHYAFSCLLLIGASFYPLRHLFAASFHSKKKMMAFKLLSCLFGLLLIIIAVTGILLSLSRGAFLAALFALIGCTLLFCLRISIKPLAILALAILVMAASLLFAPESVRDRIATLNEATTTKSGQIRLQSWKDSLDMWQAYPILGAGAESFRTAYPLYQTVNTRKTLYYAENEYVQWLVEFGLIGIALLITLVATLLYRLFHHWSALAVWQRLTFVWIFLASAAHCFLDFPLRHPTNLIALTALVTISLASTKSHSTSGKVDYSGKGPKVWLNRHATRICYLTITALAIYGLSYGSRLWRLDSYEYLETSLRKDVQEALKSAPTYPLAWFLLGNSVRNEIDSSAISLKEKFTLQKIALSCYSYNANYNSSNYVAWMTFGNVAYDWDDGSKAKNAYQKAVDLRPYLLRDVPEPLRPEILQKEKPIGG